MQTIEEYRNKLIRKTSDVVGEKIPRWCWKEINKELTRKFGDKKDALKNIRSIAAKRGILKKEFMKISKSFDSKK